MFVNSNFSLTCIQGDEAIGLTTRRRGVWVAWVGTCKQLAHEAFGLET